MEKEKLTLADILWNEDGLLPVITQDNSSNEVLMQAWINREALTEIFRTGEMWYFSRSRQNLWRKGEKSGQTQRVISLHLDCDGDSFLAKVEQTGVACHTGRKSCFYHIWDKEKSAFIEDMPIIISPEELYKS
jgi:phosphoribosyl-AMP cyclohydrolase